MWSFIIYTGKDTVFQTAFISGDTNKTAAILLSLVEPLLEKGRTLWMDNFYNLPALAHRDNDFNLQWRGNKNEANEMRQENQKPVSVLDYNENMGGVDLKGQLLQPYLLERKKMTKWYIKLFRRLLNTTVLNCMVICHANSGQTKVDHF